MIADLCVLPIPPPTHTHTHTQRCTLGGQTQAHQLQLSRISKKDSNEECWKRATQTVSQHIQNRPRNPPTYCINSTSSPCESSLATTGNFFISKYLKQAACTMSGPQPIKYQRDLCHPCKVIWCLLINVLGKKLIWLSNNSHINFCHWLPTGLSKEPSLLMLLWRP